MASPAAEWTVPVPLRTLLWWPGVTLVLLVVMEDMGLAVALTIAAGLVLVGLGAVVPPLVRLLRRARQMEAAEIGQAAVDAVSDVQSAPRTA